MEIIQTGRICITKARVRYTLWYPEHWPNPGLGDRELGPVGRAGVCVIYWATGTSLNRPRFRQTRPAGHVSRTNQCADEDVRQLNKTLQHLQLCRGRFSSAYRRERKRKLSLFYQHPSINDIVIFVIHKPIHENRKYSNKSSNLSLLYALFTLYKDLIT